MRDADTQANRSNRSGYCRTPISAFYSCAIVLACLLNCTLMRADKLGDGPKMSATQLLRSAVQGELQAQAEDHSRWMYRVRTKDAGAEEVKWVVETPEGDVARLGWINGRAISSQREQDENQRISSLVHQPDLQKKQKRAQEEDSRQTEHMFRTLPDAVIARYGRRDGDLQELLFEPDPGFHPSSREDVVFHAMAGRIWVNAKQNRLVEIEGHLLHEVKFYGGLLGYLDQGGQFHVRQVEVTPGHWEIALLHVDMRGKALFFKTISVQQDEMRSDFRRVPDNLTLAEAAEELQRRCAAQTAAAVQQLDRNSNDTR